LSLTIVSKKGVPPEMRAAALLHKAYIVAYTFFGKMPIVK